MYNAFSQSLMKKYGWNKGDGLGKNNQGITQPIKATLKFNSHGLAYKEIDTEQESKWSNMFTSAVSNLQVENDNQITIIKNNTNEEKLNLSGVNVLYKSFLKSTAVIKDGKEVKEAKPKKLKQKQKLDEFEITKNSRKKCKTSNESDLINGITSPIIEKKKKRKTINENETIIENIKEVIDDFIKSNREESDLVNKSKKKKRKNSVQFKNPENQTEEIDKNHKIKSSKAHNETEITSGVQISEGDNNNNENKDVEARKYSKPVRKKKKGVIENDICDEDQTIHKKNKAENIIKTEDLKEKQSVVVSDSTSMKTINKNETIIENIKEDIDDFIKSNPEESDVLNKSMKKKRKNSVVQVENPENQTQEIDKTRKIKRSKAHNETEITRDVQISEGDNCNNNENKGVDSRKSSKHDRKKKGVIENDICNEDQTIHKKNKAGKIIKTEDLKEKQSVVVPDSTSMTCHTSARCGITMTGKLARIQKLYEEEKLKSLSIKSVF